MYTQTFSLDAYTNQMLGVLSQCQMLVSDAWANLIARNPTNCSWALTLKLNANQIPSQSYSNVKHKMKLQFPQLPVYCTYHLTFIVYKLFLNFGINLLILYTSSQLVLLSLNIRRPSSH